MSQLTKKIKVVDYTRVSTDKQVQEGEGLEIQKERINEFCDKNNYEITKSFSDEGISGAKEICDKPAIIKMLDYCKNPPIKFVIVDKPDRLSRDIMQMLFIERELFKNNVRVLYAAQDSLNGDDMFVDAMRKMMFVFAELERKMIVKRCSDGMKKKAQGGNKSTGTQPFGYEYSTDKKTTMINENQTTIVKEIFFMRKSGLSYERIANELNNRNIYTNRNKRWIHQSIRCILKNDYYIGIVTHSGEKINGNHKAIIDMDTWNSIHINVG